MSKVKSYKGLGVPNLDYWNRNPAGFFGGGGDTDVCLLAPNSSETVSGLCFDPYVQCTNCLVNLANFDRAIEYMVAKDYISIAYAFELSLSGSKKIAQEQTNKSIGDSS